MITASEKCVIDNWSLENSALLFESDSSETFPQDIEFINALGGLSNYINAILMYEDTNFIANGYEYAWQRFEWFRQNTALHIKPLDTGGKPLNSIYEDLSSRLNMKSTKFDEIELEDLTNYKQPITRYQNLHLSQSKYRQNEHPYVVNEATVFYLMISGNLQADLFISPGRAGQILAEDKYQSTSFSKTLNKIDEIIGENSGTLWFDEMSAGITDNFFLPPLTHYIFSQAANLDDLFKILMEIKSSNMISEYKQNVKELSRSTRDFGKFQLEIESLISECFGKMQKIDKPWAVKVNILFLSFTKSFSINFKLKKTYMTFLRDLMDCRTEMYGLQHEVERLFKRKIDFNSSYVPRRSQSDSNV